MLYRAASRAEEVGADWLFHVIDDAYIFLPRVWKALEAVNPENPVVFASFGCGRPWKNAPESDNGLKVQPKGWVEPSFHCDKVWRHGGICTGAGYIVSRGGLRRLQQGRTLSDFVKDYLKHTQGRASDLASTCLFYDRGISVRNWPSGARMGNSDAAATQIAKDRSVAMVHIAFKDKSQIPGYMKQLHEASAGERERGH